LRIQRPPALKRLGVVLGGYGFSIPTTSLSGVDVIASLRVAPRLKFNQQ
jgi:hypothetical protein